VALVSLGHPAGLDRRSPNTLSFALGPEQRGNAPPPPTFTETLVANIQHVIEFGSPHWVSTRPMALTRDEWLPASATTVGGVMPSAVDREKLLDLATALTAATDPLTVAISFWIVGSCNGDLDHALHAAKFISAWDDSDDQ
jgi:hypothetical protein